MFYIGTISVASGSFANNWTGASGGSCFRVPAYGKNLYFQPNVPTGQFQFNTATGISFRASPTQAAYWGAGSENQAAGPFPIPRTDNFVIGVYSGAGPCVVLVYVDPNP